MGERVTLPRMQTLRLVVLLSAVAIACGGSSPKPPEVTPPSTDVDASVPAIVDASAPIVDAIPDAAPAVVATVADASPPPVADGCGGTASPYEAKVRPEVKKCFYAARTAHPWLTGEIHIGLNVDAQGHLMKAVIIEEKEIGKEGVACVQKALKSETLDGSGCKGKSITFSMAFGAAATK
jgi:hypothetical protein